MTSLLYFCNTRAIAVENKARHGWYEPQVICCTVEDQHSLQDWLGRQQRNSVSVLLDLPGESLELRALPPLPRWRQQLLLRGLGNASSMTGVLSQTIVHRDNTDAAVYSQLTLDPQINCAPGLACLAKHWHKVRGVYSVALLAPAYLLPPQSSDSAALLCTTQGDAAVRHCFFWHGRLYFTRDLDLPISSDQFEQQLSDSVQFIQERFIASNLASDWLGNLVCYISGDLPSLVRIKLNPASDVVALTAEPGGLLGESTWADSTLNIAQHRLFKFLMDASDARKLNGALSSYQYKWPKIARQSFTAQCGTLGSATLKAVHAGTATKLVPAALFFCAIVLLIAAGLLFQRAKSTAVENARLEDQLTRLISANSHYRVSASAMREAVLMHRTLIKDSLNPLGFLTVLGSVTGASPDIQLTKIAWTHIDMISAGEPAEHWLQAPAIRQTFSIDDDAAGNNLALVYAVSGRMPMASGSVAGAYGAYREFAVKLATHPDLLSLEAGQVPFDSAGTNTVDNRTDADRGADFQLWFQQQKRTP